jgi:membrane-associated phospholipid phosphatase
MRRAALGTAGRARTAMRDRLAGFTRSRHTWLCAVLLAGVALVTWDVLSYGPLTRLDWATHLYVEKHVRGAWWWLCYAGSLMGNEWVLYVPLGLTSLIAAAWHRSLRPLAVTAGVCIWLVLFIPLFKIEVSRSWPRSGVDLMFYPGGSEFPSGHDVNAIVIWGLFLELLASSSRRAARWLPVRTRRWLVVVATVAAGLGMVGLDYHWLSDVLAGWMLGAAIFIAILALDLLRPLREETAAGGRPAPAGGVRRWLPAARRGRRPGPAAAGGGPLDASQAPPAPPAGTARSMPEGT